MNWRINEHCKRKIKFLKRWAGPSCVRFFVSIVDRDHDGMIRNGRAVLKLIRQLIHRNHWQMLDFQEPHLFAETFTLDGVRRDFFRGVKVVVAQDRHHGRAVVRRWRMDPGTSGSGKGRGRAVRRLVAMIANRSQLDRRDVLRRAMRELETDRVPRGLEPP